MQVHDFDSKGISGPCGHLGCKDPAVSRRYLAASWANRVSLNPRGGDRQLVKLCKVHDREFAWAEEYFPE